jgi:hypothetical protein
MSFQFVEATKEQARLRMGIAGPGGGGKTYTMLAIATAMASDPSKIGVIDTERGSASKYGGGKPFRFHTLRLDPPYSPERYIEAIKAADAAGLEVLGIDSLSHAWSGTGGVLEIVDQIAKRSKSGSSFNAWRDATPQQNKLIEALLSSRCHVIATMRSKTEWSLEQGSNGKTTPKRVGMAPVQRDDVIYELDVFGEMDLDHNLIITKTRCPDLADKVFAKPGADVASVLKTWLSDGAVADRAAEQAQRSQPAPAPEPPKQSASGVVYLKAQKALKESGLTPEQWREKAKAAGVEKPAKEYTQQDLDAVLAVIGGSKSGQEAAHG